MVRRIIGAVLVAGIAAGWTAGPARADEPGTNVSELELTAGGALDSATLDGVSGGALGEPTVESSWREDSYYARPLDIQGTVNPISSGIANSADLGAAMGTQPPGSGAIAGGAATAGDAADIIF